MLLILNLNLAYTSCIQFYHMDFILYNSNQSLNTTYDKI